MDGGSDSLMAGDEAGLGDPIENAVTVATLARLRKKNTCIKDTLVIAVRVGCDRYNGVSNGATLRAMAELRLLGGFRGSLARRPKALHRLPTAFGSFRSVVSNSIVESAKGAYGSGMVPAPLQGRVQPGQLFLWPLMSELYAFDPVVMASRSALCQAIADCCTVTECYQALKFLREERLGRQMRSVEALP